MHQDLFPKKALSWDCFVFVFLAGFVSVLKLADEVLKITFAALVTLVEVVVAACACFFGDEDAASVGAGPSSLSLDFTHMTSKRCPLSSSSASPSSYFTNHKFSSVRNSTTVPLNVPWPGKNFSNKRPTWRAPPCGEGTDIMGAVILVSAAVAVGFLGAAILVSASVAFGKTAASCTNLATGTTMLD